MNKNLRFLKNFSYMILFILTFVSCSNFSARIQSIYSYKQAESEFEKADENTLVVFDVDDTLLTAADVIIRSPFRNSQKGRQIWYEYFQKYSKRPRNEATKNLLVSILMRAEYILVEESIKETIKSLQSKGVKVIACTAIIPLGKCGYVGNVEEWRYQQLKSLGIDFNSPKYCDVKFTNLPQSNGQNPIFYKGTLFTDRYPKGKAIMELIKCMKWNISKIIFFDDDPANVKSVRDEAYKRNVSVYGYEYKGEEKMSSQVCNLEIAKVQVKNLMLNEKWLSDKEAQEILSHDSNYANDSVASQIQ